jgi:hypothetical protein
MALQVIGAGFGRTGTLSLRLALEQLGFGPCYHMFEVFAHPEHNATWEAAARGEPVDWAAFLGPYGAAVDWPVCHFWRELAEAFPQAKFILTERDPEKWYTSISKTIIPAITSGRVPDDPGRQAQLKMAGLVITQKTFENRFDKDHVIAVYKRHNAAVKAALPKERLLVTDSLEGWGPICAFLGVPVPATPFPKTNSTDEFRAMVQL